jgi:hypothetical protein
VTGDYDWTGRQCQWVYGEEYDQCGLLVGHDGDHVPFTPGEYLPAPLLDPVEELLVRWRYVSDCDLVCPNGCTRYAAGRSMWGPWRHDAFDMSKEPTIAHIWTGDDWHVTDQLNITMSPCGCEFRQIPAAEIRPHGAPFSEVCG